MLRGHTKSLGNTELPRSSVEISQPSRCTSWSIKAKKSSEAAAPLACSRSGSKAQDKGDSRTPCFVGCFCSCGLRGPEIEPCHKNHGQSKMSS